MHALGGIHKSERTPHFLSDSPIDHQVFNKKHGADHPYSVVQIATFGVRGLVSTGITILSKAYPISFKHLIPASTIGYPVRPNTMDQVS